MRVCPVTGKKVLIIDDEAPIREMIAVALEMAGYEYMEAENSQQAHEMIVDHRPDLVLVDWMMPGGSGVELTRRLKKDATTAEIPVIMLTAKSEEDNKIQGLEVGADDYMTKPFSMDELEARIEAILRRSAALPDTEDEVGEMRIGLYTYDYNRQELRNGDAAQRLTTKENELLFLLAKAKNALLEREYALNAIWGDANYFNGRSMDVYIAKLRKHLKADSRVEILNVHGKGFKLIAD